MRWFGALTILFYFSSVSIADEQCTYSYYKWNARAQLASDLLHVSKPYAELKSYEVDAMTGCSLCSEDQVEIDLPHLKPFRVCKFVAADIDRILRELIEQGEQIKTVVGYRVGMTRGEMDNKGYRTQFSNHSFGIALDINEAHNGLYDNCIAFNSQCRLVQGGVWKPSHRLSLTANAEIVRRFNEVGFLWGGDIMGKQKDFMHFSPTGY